jgi:polyribonucleotide nucleotidyltransferase
MHLYVAGTKDAIMMVEAGAKEVPEEQMLAAIMFGHEEIKKIAEFIESFREEALNLGLAKPKREVVVEEIPADIAQRVKEWAYDKLDRAVRTEEKLARQEAIDQVYQEALEFFAEEFPEQLDIVEKVLEDITHKIIRRLITVEHIRPDGRAMDEIRPISIEIGRLPRTHGSACLPAPDAGTDCCYFRSCRG